MIPASFIVLDELLMDNSATDQFNSLSASILPFVFLAKHDNSSTAVASTFSNVWSENTGGTGAIKLYLQEITKLAQESLSSQRWAVKQAAAITLSDICSSIGKDITKDQLEVIYPAILSAVGGKSWDGKEKVLEGLVELEGNLKAIPDGRRTAEVKQIVLREAKRKNKAYQAHALKSLGKFAGFQEEDMFEEVEQIISSAMEGGDEQDKMDIDENAGQPVSSP